MHLLASMATAAGPVAAAAPTSVVGRAPSTRSAYMLSYVRESDLGWVLNARGGSPAPSGDAVHATDASASAAADEIDGDGGEGDVPPGVMVALGLAGTPTKLPTPSAISEDAPMPPPPSTPQGEGNGTTGDALTLTTPRKHETQRHLGPYVTVPFATDLDLAAFDSIEGGYVPRYVPRDNDSNANAGGGGVGCTRLLHDFCLWDGRVPTAAAAANETLGSIDIHCSHRPHRMRVRTNDSGYSLLRRVAVELDIPIHRLRLWSTSRRENCTVRVDRAVTSAELGELNVEKILGEHLGWTYDEGRSGIKAGTNGYGGNTTQRKRGGGKWHRPNGRHGFYVEVLPLNRTNFVAVNDQDDALISRPHFLHPSLKNFEYQPDFPAEAYLSSLNGEACIDSESLNSLQGRRKEKSAEDLAKLGALLSDEELHEIYSRIVPDVPEWSALLFFKELVFAPPASSYSPNNGKEAAGDAGGAREAGVAAPCGGAGGGGGVRYIGSSLFRDVGSSTTRNLMACASQLSLLARDDGLLAPPAGSKTTLLEIVSPRKIDVVNVEDPVRLDHEDLDLSSGDCFLLAARTSSERGEGKDAEELLRERVVKHFRTEMERVWMHFLPLSAKDAFLMKRPVPASEGDDEKSADDKKRRNRPQPQLSPLAASLAVPKSMPVSALLRLLHSRFFHAAKVPSPQSLRLTPPSIPPSGTSAYMVHPSLSSKAGSPFLHPPLPAHHPIDLNARYEANRRLASRGDDGQVERLDVKWLAELNDNVGSIGRKVYKRIRHHYAYFDAVGGEGTAAAEDGAALPRGGPAAPRKSSWLFAVLLPGRTPPDAEGAILRHRRSPAPICRTLPLSDLALPLDRGSTVMDVLREAVGVDAFPSCATSDPAAGAAAAVLTLVKRNRTVRILPLSSVLSEVYPLDVASELPRGRIEPANPNIALNCASLLSGRARKGRRGKGNAKGTKRKRNGGGAGDAATTVPLRWNNEARRGCLEIGGDSAGTLVVQFLPPVKDMLGGGIEGTDSEDGGDALSAFALPRVVPIQVVFYIDHGNGNNGGDDLELCFVPLLTYLRRNDGPEELKHRVWDRLYGKWRDDRASSDAPRRPRRRTTLDWKASVLSPVRQRLSPLPSESKKFKSDADIAMRNGDCGDDEGTSFDLWRGLRSMLPAAFERGGGVSRLARHLSQTAPSSSSSGDLFRCETTLMGDGGDLPTIALAVPPSTLDDLVRCRASLVVGSAHLGLPFDDGGRLSAWARIPSRCDEGGDGADSGDDGTKRRKVGHGVGIEIHR